MNDAFNDNSAAKVKRHSKSVAAYKAINFGVLCKAYAREITPYGIGMTQQLGATLRRNNLANTQEDPRCKAR